MSLVEAAAALDRLLRGHQDGGAPPNVPPYAPPPPTPDDSNLLPTFFPNTHSSKATLSSTPTGGGGGSPLSSIFFPWENLPTCIPDEEPNTPFCRTFSPLPSPIPIPAPTPTLPALPSPLYPPHWVESLDQLPSEEDLPDVLSQSARTTEDISKRQRRRRSTRANSESAASTAILDEDFVPLDPEKYKTELCRSYQVHGHCRYGARCNYAHGLEELRGASRHGKYKTRNCQSYHQTGFCRYGARCSFIHDPEEGILKCSIANKEVLEALHYRPSSEDSPRTANITWRFLEATGETIPELHFISSTSPSEDQYSIHSTSDPLEEVIYSHSPLQRQINFLISSDDSLDESRLFTCTVPFRNEVSVLNSTILLQENLDLLRSLQTGEDASKPDTVMISEGQANSSNTLLDASVVDKTKKPSGGSVNFMHRLPLFDTSNFMSLSLSPIKPAMVKELCSDGEMCEESSAKPEETPLNICQELKDLEVVHSILQRAPLYSSMVWSDGADLQQVGPEKKTADAATQRTEDNEHLHEGNIECSQEEKGCNYTKPSSESGSSKRRLRNASRKKRRMGLRYNSQDFDDLGLTRVCQGQTSKPDNIFSSDTGDESGDLEVSTGAAGADGDNWSENSSLHLADLLRSLRLREGSNQLLPWSKSDRRYSSDGSSAGPMSAKDPRSSPSSPASPRQHDMTKYKTELCRSFQYNGYCSYGDACLYAHGPVDLRSYPKHPMYRTKQCFSFHNKGFCLYGSRCQFLHDLE